MGWPEDLTTLLKRISTPAEEVFKGLRVLGDYNKTNLDAHDLAIKALMQHQVGTVYYVDPTNGLDTNDGLSWAGAFKTMTVALAACSNGDTVLLTGALTEDVITMNDYTTGPSDITIRGADYGQRRPLWLGAGAANIITLNCAGWVFENIRFNLHTGYAGIFLRMDAQAGGAYSTTIKDCEFQGVGATKCAIDIGMGYRTKVLNCLFHDLTGVAGTAIGQTVGVAWAVPSIHVEGCRFTECTRQFYVDGVNGSLFLNNYFSARGGVVATTHHLYMYDPGTSGYNIMYGNLFGGTYTIAGGYQFESNDSFTGNFADHCAAETGGIGVHGEIIALPA